MNRYRTYNCVAVTFLIAVSGFLCVLILGTDPQGAQSSPAQSASVPAPEIDPTVEEDVQLAQADDAEIQGDMDEAIATDTVENLGQDLSEGDAPIEISADASQDTANLASAIEFNGGSDTGTVPSNYSSYSSGTGSSGASSGSGSYSSPVSSGAFSGSGGSSGGLSSGSGSGSGSETGTDTGTGTDSGTGTGTGGSGNTGTGNGGSIFPDPDTDTDTGTGTGTDTGTDNPPDNPTDGGNVPADNALPEWIDREGIRAGFIPSTAGNLSKIPRYVDTLKTIGMNSAIVYGCSFAETPNHLINYREWTRQFNLAGLHVFAYYPWQPPVGNACRPVVFADGTEGLFPCPLDNQLWQKYLEGDIANKLAHEAIVGIFLDMEMYRTENEPVARKHYSFDTCFCDTCFSRFILNRAHLLSLPPVGKEQRKSWLLQNGFLPDYYAYLIEQVESKTEQLKNKALANNSGLVFGVYPALNTTNWVRNAIMRAFGRNSRPAISFSTDTYGYNANPWGADRIPSDLSAYFEQYNINGIYASGYLLRRYTSADIGTQITKSYQRSQGYWLFHISQLLESQVSQEEELAGGSQADYLQAIQDANAALLGDE